MRFLSLLRLNGHLGPYSRPHPFSKGKKSDKANDCLHWCLLGPIDSWNDVIMQMAVDGRSDAMHGKSIDSAMHGRSRDKPGFKPGDKPPGKGHPPKEESKN
ncbi:hypothetical protein Droror1_Dr00008501 [Drosera rotundifolia]